jgi:anti-sigma-K factor RskA
MTYEDIQIFSLSPVDETTSGSGKFMVSFLHREGLLELKDMPTLGTNQAFQVWLISDGRSYSIGSFVPSRTERYIPIENIPYLPKNKIDMVRVTIEPLTGSDLPQGPAVLFGSINGTAGSR